MTGANYQQYEVGEREFTPERLQEILSYLRATEADLEIERARLLSAPQAPANDTRPPVNDMVFDVYARAQAGPLGHQVRDSDEPIRQIDLRQVLGKNVGATEVAGESMIPWAEPGEIVLFDRGRHPRRGYGCVIETKAGEFYVKFYSHMDGSTLFVRELNPEDRLIQFPLADLRGVYAVRLRGD
jgi:phage repressor protein C with HTH and peptisase S24 domain